jgi:SAM-dependent methyltransferase
MLSMDEAIRTLRDDPRYAGVVRDAYLGPDVLASAKRFYHSAEFAEVIALAERFIHGGSVLDLGAGVGVASYAFAQNGASAVYALEPDLSREVGCGALLRLRPGLPIEIFSVDLVYARQVLHHTRDLPGVLRECARVLKPGGAFLACREHVVDDEHQLNVFLKNHPIHQLAGGEHAYPLGEYLSAIELSGLQLVQVIGPWDSVINAYPGVRSAEELKRFPRTLLRQKLGVIGAAAGYVPGIQALVWRRVKRPGPGRMYTFFAVKA